MPDSVLMTGALESTNEPYAIAKITGIKLCESFNRQYGTDFRYLEPMLLRWHHAKSPIHADRNHIHHLLLDAGFSVNQAVRFLLLLSFAIGLTAAWLSLNFPYEKAALLINFILMTLVWYALSDDRARIVAKLYRVHGFLYGKSS